MRSTRVALVAVLFTAALGAQSVLAGNDLVCDQGLGSPVSGTWDDVVVPEGAFCRLDGASVGDVTVYGALLVFGTEIRGDLHAEPGHMAVQLRGLETTTVGGGVQLKGGQGPFNSFVSGAEVQGDVQLEENLNTIGVALNLIMGDLQVFGNHGDDDTVGADLHSPHSARIGGNTILGDLQCDENSPAPIQHPWWDPNVVAGEKEGQCSADNGF